MRELAIEDRRQAIILAPPDAFGIVHKHYSPALGKLTVEENYRDYSVRSAKNVAAFLAHC